MKREDAVTVREREEAERKHRPNERVRERQRLLREQAERGQRLDEPARGVKIENENEGFAGSRIHQEVPTFSTVTHNLWNAEVEEELVGFSALQRFVKKEEPMD